MSTVKPIGSSPDNAAYKVQSTDKAGQKAASGAVAEKPVEIKQIYPVSGVIASPGVVEPESYAADYYREGAPLPGDRNKSLPSRLISPFFSEKEGSSTPYASIRLRGRDVKNNNKEIDFIPAYTKFILESVQESSQERSQIIETFGETWVFLFGTRPLIYNFSGTLINTRNANWVQDFDFIYNNFLKGTRAVELKARTIISYGGRQVEGFLLSTSNQTVAATEEGVPFQMQMIVTKRNYLGFSEDFGIVRGPGGQTISDENLRRFVNQVAGPEGKGTSNPETSDDQNAVKTAMKGGSPASFKPIV